MPFLQSDGIRPVSHTPRITATNHFTATLFTALSNSAGIPQMSGAFHDFNRRTAFATSSSVGGSQEIVASAKQDSASFIKSYGIERC